MDPDANLKEQRAILARLDSDETQTPTRDLFRLAELVQALDEWLTRGGFLPAGWKRPQTAVQAALRDILAAYEDELTRQNNGAPIMSNRITQARAALKASQQ